MFGAIITRPAPDMVEIFGALGYDFVMIDCEHGPATLDQVEHMVRAAESFGITPIARVPDHHEQTILRLSQVHSTWTGDFRASSFPTS